MTRSLLASVTVLAGVLAVTAMPPAARADKKAAVPAPVAVPAWLGKFHPQLAAGACATACEVAGSVRVFAPTEGGAAATGDVAIVHPLSGSIAAGHIDHDVVSVASLHFDPRRDGDDGVIVLPATIKPVIVKPTAAEVAAIRAIVLHDDAIGGVKKALVGLEIGAVDVDGNGTADFAVTYGCSQWFDGQCQVHGQFFFARRGAKWVEIE